MKQSIKDLGEIRGKKALIRVDVNVPLDENKNVTDDTRIQAIVPTVKYLQEKGARLGYNLISSHCFIDGNKRIGMLVMLSFFKANGVKLTYTNDDVIKIGLGIASGEINYKQLIIWVKSHQKEVELNSVL